MEDIEFFSSVDTMLSEILTVKSLKEMCTEIEAEVQANMGKYVDNYKLSSEIGEKGEKVVRKFMKSLGYVVLSKCIDITHDYKLLKDGKEYLIEIKTDVGHMRPDKKTGEIYDTGNIPIEYECRGKASGIAATKADFFIIYLPYLNEIWLIRTQKLKRLIIERADSIINVENAGDKGSNTKIHLLKRKIFKDEFRVAAL